MKIMLTGAIALAFVIAGGTGALGIAGEPPSALIGELEGHDGNGRTRLSDARR